MRILFRLIRLVLPYWKWIGLAVVLGSATVLSSTALMATSAFLISMAALQPSIASLQVAIVGVRFFGIARGVFRYLERLVSHRVNFHLLARFRVWFYQSIEPLALDRLAAYQSGDLLKRVVGDVESLREFYVRVLAAPLVAVVSGGVVLLFIGSQGLHMAVILITTYAIIGFAIPALIYLLSRIPSSRLNKVRGEFSVAAVESMQGVSDILAFQQEKERNRYVEELMGEFRKQEVKLAAVQGLQNGLSTLVSDLGLWLVLVAAIPMVYQAQMEGVMLAVVVLGALASFEAVLPLPLLSEHLQSSIEAGGRLFEISDSEQVKERVEGGVDVGDNRSVVFRDVSFGYPNEDELLKDISFDLLEERKVAIVGPSGAGKTTVLNLLLRFWELQRGDITVGVKDIRVIDPDVLREGMAVISQDTYLFNDTIEGNVRLGEPAASKEKILLALERAELSDFIETLPEGPETMVGEHGMALSAGQRQRVAIARAILKDAPLLVLDEATVNLDAVTEGEILSTIFEVWEKRSVLMATHRLVGLGNMDEILVLQDGEIVERGSQEELIEHGGWFRQMREIQRSVFDFD